ncbi:hypothetical protein ES703_113787 [subsurface metagenome]
MQSTSPVVRMQVDLGAVGKEQFDDFLVAVTCRISQRVRAVIRCGVYISTFSDEQFDHLRKTALACLLQKGTPFIGFHSDVCAFAQQILEYLLLPSGQRPISGGPAEFVRRIDVHAALDELFYLGQIPFEYSILESRDIDPGPDELFGHVWGSP